VWRTGGKPFVLFRETVETDIHTIVKEILPVSEYACLTYRYQAVVSRVVNGKSLLGFNKVIFVLDGVIKLGFDCGEIRVSESRGTVTLSMPPVKILSHEQYPETAQVYDESRGLFAPPFSVKEQLELLGDNKQEQERKVRENGELFASARAAAEQLFKPLLEINPAVKGKYAIVFDWRDE